MPLKPAGADVALAESELSAAGTRARFRTPVGDIAVQSPLVGDFNLANIALAVGMGVARGLPPRAIADGVGALAAVPGRLQRVANERGVLCVVDYAHTPDALERGAGSATPHHATCDFRRAWPSAPANGDPYLNGRMHRVSRDRS